MQHKIILFCFFISVVSFGQSTDFNADEIIQKTQLHLSANSPENALSFFQYINYSKGVFTTRDKTSQSLIHDKSDYIFEEIAQHRFDQNQKHQKTILEAHHPGFEKLFYPLFAKTFFSTSLYEDEFIILDQRFHSPLSRKGDKQYYFELKETVNQAERPYFVIHFSPANSRAASQLSGVLHIDKESFALQKASITHHKNKAVNLAYDFQFFEEKEIWFPIKTTATVTLLNAVESFNVFGNRIPVTRMNFEEDKETSFVFESHHSEITFQEEEAQSKNQIAIIAAIESTTIDTSANVRFRESELSTQELAIAERAQTTVKENNIEKRIERLDAFGFGFYELGFFDYDLKLLFKYNNYEGFRTGVGGVTNEKLSKRFRFGGYLVRGFTDKEFKFQLSTDYILSEKTNTVLGVAYTQDVAELGSNEYLTDSRTFSLFEPRLLNIIQFYKHKTWQASLSHSFSPQVYGELQMSQSAIAQTLPYEFVNNNVAYADYNLTQAQAGVLFSPFGKFMETPRQVEEYDSGYPRFSLQVTQAFDGVAKGDFNFTKIDFRTDYLVHHINRSSTEIILEGNLGLGDIPLTHLYHAYPNSPVKETIMKRFSVAGIKSFETMYFGEFFSDRLATIHVKHQFKPFLIAPWLKPELVLITRHAIGTASNLDNHQNISFNTLEKGYSESGLELNQLVFGFGLSLAYRYGAYHLPNFEDNISFKFTFNLKL